MTSTLIYNDVTFHNLLTKGWREAVVYDQSNTDAIGIDYEISVQGLVHTPAIVDTDGDNTFVADHDYAGAAVGGAVVYRSIHRKLMTPRKFLQYKVDGNEVLHCHPCTQFSVPDRDIANGPKPMHVDLMKVIGNTFWIDFTVRCRKHLCSGKPPVVLNNRWSVRERMDDSFFMTRTIQGRLELSRSDVSPHTFRHMVVPALEDGFRRDSAEFVATADNLALDYTLTEQQVYTAAPWPCTKIQGSYEVSSEDGVNQNSSMQLSLWGAPDSNQKIMLLRAMQICDAKTQFRLLRERYQAVLQHFSIREAIGEENRIDVSLQFLNAQERDGEVLGHLVNRYIGQPLSLEPIPQEPQPYNPNVSVLNSPWGYQVRGRGDSAERTSGVLEFLRCYLQTPCEPPHNVGRKVDLATAFQPLNTYQRIETRVTGFVGEMPLQTQTSYLSESQRDGMYLFAHYSNVYETENNVLVFPSTNGPNNQIYRPCGFVTKRVITFDAERVGQPPDIPQPVPEYEEPRKGKPPKKEIFAPDGGDEKDKPLKAVLTHSKIVPYPPRLTPDGLSSVHRISGEYVYYFTRSLTSEDQVRLGQVPFVAWPKGAEEKYTKMTGKLVFKEHLTLGQSGKKG